MFYILALLSGFFIIGSMFINSKLSIEIGKIESLIVAMAVGSLVSFLAFLSNIYITTLTPDFSLIKIWMLSGGAIYIALTLMFNKSVPKVAAIYTAVIVFISQIFMGNIIDYIMYGQISLKNIIGALLIATGLLINSYIDKPQLNLDSTNATK
ncbi:MAG: DMT family transporter [Acidaminobacteraceae bacterium]